MKLRMPKAKVILYGSQARGEADENSDFDILIDGETKHSFQMRMKSF